MKPIYTAVFLDLTLGDLDRIAAPFGGVENLRGTLHAHHITLKFRPTDEEVLELGGIYGDRLREGACVLGSRVEVTLCGMVDRDGVQALRAIPGGWESSNKVPHLTVATDPGVKPFHSNAALEQGVEPIQHIHVEGRLGVFMSDGTVAYTPEGVAGI
jgi:hypothetical protein